MPADPGRAIPFCDVKVAGKFVSLSVMRFLQLGMVESGGLGVSSWKFGLVGGELNEGVKLLERKTLCGVPECGRCVSIGFCNVKMFSAQEFDATFLETKLGGCEKDVDSAVKEKIACVKIFKMLSPLIRISYVEY